MSCLRSDVPPGLRDVWHCSEDAGCERPKPGEATAGSPQGEPWRDS